MKEQLDFLLIDSCLTGTIGEDSTRYIKFMKLGYNLLYSIKYTKDEVLKLEKKYGNEVWYVLDKKEDNVFTFRHPSPPNLSLVVLAGNVKDRGYNCQIIDNIDMLKVRREQFDKVLVEKKPIIVGINTNHIFKIEKFQEMIAHIRKLSPGSKIVIGGRSAEIGREYHKLADYVVFGSGEGTIVEIIEHIKGERKLESIINICYKKEDGTLWYSDFSKQQIKLEKKGKTLKTGPSKVIGKAHWKIYGRNKKIIYPIEFSKGCTYNCRFCSYYRNKLTKSMKQIKEEFLENDKLGIKRYRFLDSNFPSGTPSNPRFPYDICKLIIELGLGIEWSCFSRADTIDEELASLMAQAGCIRVLVGVESANNEILKNMNKGYKIEDIPNKLEIFKKYGIQIGMQMVIGFPGESEETVQESIDFVKLISPEFISAAHYYVEQFSPATSEDFSSKHGLVGKGRYWKHNSMESSYVRDVLLDKFSKEVSKAGINFGNDTHFYYMGIEEDLAMKINNIINRINKLKPNSKKYIQEFKNLKDLVSDFWIPFVIEDIREMMKS